MAKVKIVEAKAKETPKILDYEGWVDPDSDYYDRVNGEAAQMIANMMGGGYKMLPPPPKTPIDKMVEEATKSGEQGTDTGGDNHRETSSPDSPGVVVCNPEGYL